MNETVMTWRVLVTAEASGVDPAILTWLERAYADPLPVQDCPWGAGGKYPGSKSSNMTEKLTARQTDRAYA